MSHPARPLLAGSLLAVVSVAVLISAFAADYVNPQADETLLAWMAKQASTGQVPYVDFFCVHPPLSVYGLRFFFGLFGASLGALRLLTIAWLLASTLGLYVTLIKSQVPPLWSAALAFQLPALIVPFWPIPSHHWFALGLGLAALSLVTGGQAPISALCWFSAGLLAGLAGLCLQTDGALFTALALLNLPFGRNLRATRRAVAFFLLGLLLPIGTTIIFLLRAGALPDAWYCLVLWPGRYYKQPGGFNDVSPLPFLWNTLLARIPRPFTPAAIPSLLTFLAALLLPVLGLLSLGLSPALRKRARAHWHPLLRATAGYLLVFTTYVMGRADWMHLVLFLPLLMLIPVQEIDWTQERLRPALWKTVVLLLTVWACVRWPLHWAASPPLVQSVLRADAQLAQNGPAAVLASLPDVTSKQLPVVYLPYGSSLYFFWAPVPPPMDWVMPPSFKYNAPQDFELFAAFLERRAVPYVLIRTSQAEMFLTEPSPVSDVLRRSYKLERTTPWGILFKRLSYTAPEGPHPRGKSP